MQKINIGHVMTKEDEFTLEFLTLMDKWDEVGIPTAAWRQRIAEIGAVAAVKEYLNQDGPTSPLPSGSRIR